MLKFGDFAVAKCGNADVYFLCDTEFADDVSNNTWTLDSCGYVCRNKNGAVQRLHNFVIETSVGKAVPSGMYVDHINRCKTDNRLCNLRIVDPATNSKNLPIKTNNSTGVTGVSKGRGGSGWRAYITVNKKRIELGTYKTIEEAARVRYAAEEKFGFTHRQNLAAFLIEMEDYSETNRT